MAIRFSVSTNGYSARPLQRKLEAVATQLGIDIEIEGGRVSMSFWRTCILAAATTASSLVEYEVVCKDVADKDSLLEHLDAVAMKTELHAKFIWIDDSLEDPLPTLAWEEVGDSCELKPLE